MKKFGFRIFIGIIAFVIGIGSVGLSYLYQLHSQIEMYENESQFSVRATPVKTSNDGKIEVKFKEFNTRHIQSRSKYELSAEFELTNYNDNLASVEIINYNNNPASIASYDRDDFMTKRIKVDDKLFNSHEFSSVGLGNEYLLSGDSRVVWVSNYTFHEYLKGENIQVGFDFKIGNQKETQTFWSQKFQISDGMKEQIKKGIAELKKESKQNQ